METIVAETPQEWRDWLRENHDRASAVWLVFYRKHVGKSTIDIELSVETAICFGWVKGGITSIDSDRYAIKFFPREPKDNWSDSDREIALKAISSGAMTEAGMSAVRNARENGVWYMKSDMVEMPSELEILLDENPEAAVFFAELAPSYRKQYMVVINRAAKSELRMKLAKEAVRSLANHQKLPLT